MDTEAAKFLLYLRAEKNSSVHTLKAYEFDLKQFYRLLGDKPVASVTKDLVRSYLAQMNAQGLSKRTVGRRMAALRTFFRYLVREGHVEKNPLASVRNPKLDKKLTI